MARWGGMVVFPQFPSKPVAVRYYAGVPAATLAAVQARLAAGDPQYDYCFVNPRLVVLRRHLYCAVYRALQNERTGAMRARLLHAECLLCLSAVSNIADALRRFGVAADCPDVIVIKIGGDANVDHWLGAPSPLTDEALFAQADLEQFRKVYKCDGATQDELTRLAVAACQLRGL